MPTTYAIPNGATVFAATTYTGNGSSQSISNGANNPTGKTFYTDFLWQKARSSATDNIVYDTNRGSNYLVTNSTAADVSSGIISLTSTGFNAGSGSAVNSNSVTYVAWMWNAGSGTTSSNTSGSITSTVSVNATAGFSVVTWTNPASGNPTIGHGLGVAPTFIIVKDRTFTYNWDVGCTSIGWANRLNLNATSAAYSPAFWNSTAPTSTVFTYAASGANSGDSMVAYCWTPVAGYSAFGSYTGNGSADGPFVYLGFRPRFILYKNSSFAGTGWAILDSSRNTYNVENARLFADSSGAEDTSVSPMDFTSNGFKVRSTNDGVNRSGDTIIYACFAENPFKYANAR